MWGASTDNIYVQRSVSHVAQELLRTLRVGGGGERVEKRIVETFGLKHWHPTGLYASFCLRAPRSRPQDRRCPISCYPEFIFLFLPLYLFRSFYMQIAIQSCDLHGILPTKPAILHGDSETSRIGVCVCRDASKLHFHDFNPQGARCPSFQVLELHEQVKKPLAATCHVHCHGQKL